MGLHLRRHGMREGDQRQAVDERQRCDRRGHRAESGTPCCVSGSMNSGKNAM